MCQISRTFSLLRFHQSISPGPRLTLWLFHNMIRFYLSTSPNPQTGRPTLVGCPLLLIQYILSYPQYWRLFFHPQLEDAPCRCDRDPLLTACCKLPWKYTGRTFTEIEPIRKGLKMLSVYRYCVGFWTSKPLSLFASGILSSRIILYDSVVWDLACASIRLYVQYRDMKARYLSSGVDIRSGSSATR